MSTAKEQNEMKIEIQLDENTSKGQYVNAVISQFSATEFILDFLFLAPGQNKTKVSSRVILAPEHAKRLLLNMQNSISHYEQSYGEIKLREQPPVPKQATANIN